MNNYRKVKAERDVALKHLIKTHRDLKQDRVKVVAFMKKEADYWQIRYKKIAELLAKAKAKKKEGLVAELEAGLVDCEKFASDALARYELEKKILVDETKR